MDNELKQQVLEQLRLGRTNAIPAKILASRLGFQNDRQIRYAIRQLISDGIPVASSVVSPVGFFVAETKEEVALYAATIKSRLIEDAYRRRDFLRASLNIRQPEQMKFGL